MVSSLKLAQEKADRQVRLSGCAYEKLFGIYEEIYARGARVQTAQPQINMVMILAEGLLMFSR